MTDAPTPAERDETAELVEGIHVWLSGVIMEIETPPGYARIIEALDRLVALAREATAERDRLRASIAALDAYEEASR